MRTITLLILGFLQTLIVAQPFQITFTGSGMSNTVTTIEVQNLTQGTTLTLAGTDILELVTNIGIFDGVQTNGELVIYPNPAESTCGFEFYNRQSGDVRIELFDAAGKRLLLNEDYLTLGSHKYELAGLNSGMYLLKVNTPASPYSVKIIATGVGEGLPLLRYVTGNSLSVDQAKIASSAGTIQMQYFPGDWLLFKGISGNYSRIITMLPTQNWTVNFEFIASTDADGNHYPVVTIGTQTWMAENLKTTKYSNGDPVLNVTDSTDWKNMTVGAYCWYNNDYSTYGNVYGALYNWYAVSNTKGLCPTGWRVPTNGELTTLTSYLGGESFAGGPLKEIGTLHWASPNTSAINSSGFSALPAGQRTENGKSDYISHYGYLWSLSESSTSNAWRRVLYYNEEFVYRDNIDKNAGYSVRCILSPPPVYCGGTATVTDINGNVYNTVPIGAQCWMKENLQARSYRNGTAIPLVANSASWGSLSTGARCWYKNDSATYAATYGAMYNWYAVDNSNGLCPTGWHVPTDTEWTILTDLLGGESFAGGPLKETGTAHWYSPNTGATNSSGFTALPGGYRDEDYGGFDDLGSFGIWWSPSAYSATNAWFRMLYNHSTSVGRTNSNKENGFSVRCVRNY